MLSDEAGRAVEVQFDVPLYTELTITSFTASPDPVDRGRMVALSWDAPGAAYVGITRLNPEDDTFLQAEGQDLPASGSITVQVPEEYVTTAQYCLGARDTNGVLKTAYVTVGIICRYSEFIAPHCPLTQDYVWAAYEPFQRGHMLWRSDTREIYALYDGGSYETYQDTWQEGDPIDIPGTPPPGLYEPLRGFGNLWVSEPLVRERLGWATASERGYTVQVETTRGAAEQCSGICAYLTLPDGRVLHLQLFSSIWQFTS